MAEVKGEAKTETSMQTMRWYVVGRTPGTSYGLRAVLFASSCVFEDADGYLILMQCNLHHTCTGYLPTHLQGRHANSIHLRNLAPT